MNGIAKTTRILLLVLGIPLLFIVGCQSKLIYFPRPYGPESTAQWATKTHGRAVDFTTSQGKQRAFLQGNLQSPRNLWFVCGGNGTLALDWSDWLEQHTPKQDAWLLFDMPGYGDCEGSPSPAHIRESLEAAMPAAFQKINWPQHPNNKRLRFFGHSLGGAVSLMAATEFKIQRGVLVSPFTSTMEMSRAITGLPLGFLVWHRFDNSARLSELSARGPGQVIILHGTADEVIPITMSRDLAADHPGIIQLTEIPGGRHNTIQEKNSEELAAAIKSCGE
ncbi:MAG: alpha/beta hydrolase [Gloeobacteraceae cyanobacterium ES-bin-144]|nr:alpha/beta hydrolase [Verrucomicrobiales bacterium]